MKDNAKILKGILLTIIMVPIIIFVLWYIWLLYDSLLMKMGRTIANGKKEVVLNRGQQVYKKVNCNN